ncbi:MAG TPA: hypothetical protein VHM92_11795 [Allosphingosinicella sp.]|nr:hypothetical protein [Allosphingosinicella sp.]
MRKWIAGSAAAAILAAGAVAAKAPKPQARPEAFEALVRCRAIADDAARLACFDTAARKLEEAANQRQLVVVDRKQIQETKRNLFGLDIPNLNPFGGGADEEEVKSIEGVVATAVQEGDGRWVVVLKEGGTWAQTDNNALALRPRPGQKVKIVKASLGTYMMRVNGQPGVRAKRRI